LALNLFPAPGLHAGKAGELQRHDGVKIIRPHQAQAQLLELFQIRFGHVVVAQEGKGVVVTPFVIRAPFCVTWFRRR
jgi:hypothetical protein